MGLFWYNETSEIMPSLRSNECNIKKKNQKLKVHELVDNVDELSLIYS